MNLEEIRKKIDQTDSELVGLLSKRMSLSIRAGRVKNRVEDKEREEQILDRVKSRRDRLISPTFSEKIYREIIEESKRLQRKKFKLSGFQGERGAFGEIACTMYSDTTIPVPCVEFSDVFEGVLKGELDYGVVPIENSSEGAITSVSHLVTENDLNIVGEVLVRVHHSLLAPPNVGIKDISVVYSHPQALAQCRNFLARNELEPRPYYDTAGAAAMIGRDRPIGAGAIANEVCSDLYGLKVIDDKIEDSKSNFTRFLVLSMERGPSKGNKCSITFSTADKAGALTSVLRIFNEAGINLTMIESIPSRDSPDKARFLIDFMIQYPGEEAEAVLEKIRNQTSGFKLLGFYRSWSE